MMKMYKAKLKTAGKTVEEVLATYDSMKPSQEEVENTIASFNLIDGLVVGVLGPTVGGGYALAGWDSDADAKIRDFIYQAEQDEFFGSYINERDQFLEDWDSENYDPGASLSFAAEDIQILEEIKSEKA